MTIDHYKKNVNSDYKNAMPFDLTKLGYVYLEASWYYGRERRLKKSKDHLEYCKNVMMEAENRL